MKAIVGVWKMTLVKVISYMNSTAGAKPLNSIRKNMSTSQLSIILQCPKCYLFN